MLAAHANLKTINGVPTIRLTSKPPPKAAHSARCSLSMDVGHTSRILKWVRTSG